MKCFWIQMQSFESIILSTFNCCFNTYCSFHSIHLSACSYINWLIASIHRRRIVFHGTLEKCMPSDRPTAPNRQQWLMAIWLCIRYDSLLQLNWKHIALHSVNTKWKSDFAYYTYTVPHRRINRPNRTSNTIWIRRFYYIFMFFLKRWNNFVKRSLDF